MSFYAFAALYPLGALGAWITPRRAVVWLAACFVCCACVACAIDATLRGDDPLIMLRIFTRQQVARQLATPQLVLMSVGHFALGDAVIMWQVVALSRRLRMPVWRLAALMPGMMWCMPIGLLPWLAQPEVVRWIVD